MSVFEIKKLTNISQITILLTGVLLALNAFFIHSLFSSHFELSMLTLDSLLPSGYEKK